MSRKVLIVDDSITVRQILKTTLTDAGYEVCDADDGQAALDLVGQKDYDLLMTDLNMPLMDGLEFITKVRALPGRRFLPIVVLSGDCKQARSRECSQAGASGFLQKPFEKEQVLRILQTIIPY